MTATITHHGVTAWSVPAIADAPILPFTQPGLSLDLYAVAYREQWVPLSFCLRSTNRCTIRLSVSDDESDVYADLRWVKISWQSDRPWDADQHPPVLVPKFLVKDPTLITAQPDKTDAVRQPTLDAAELEPLELPQNVTQQVWVLVKVYGFATPGRYRITIKVEVGNAQHWDAFEVPVLIDVLPGDLPPSPMTRAVYYRGLLYGHPNHPDTKTEEQYRGDLRNMRRHGVTHPLWYEDFNLLHRDEAARAKLHKLVELWRNIGYNPSTVHIIASPWSGPGTVERLTELTKSMLASMKKEGINTVYAYSRDEPTAEAMHGLIPMHEAMRAAGLKTMMACSQRNAEALEILGPTLDLVLTANPATPTQPWHDLGAKVWLYDATYYNTKPDHYFRKFYGLGALAAGFDGVCPYAYQHQMGDSIWNDCDHKWPDHVLAAPTLGAPLDSIQWEAYREAGNDAARGKG